MTEQDIIIRLKDDSGKEYILYPATKAENIIGQFDKSKVGLDNVPNVSTNDQTPTFTESETRTNIVSGEKLSILFGKVRKFFTDLKTVAFTGSYSDLSNKPTSMQNPNSLTLTMNGSSSSYNGASSASKSWYAPTSAGTAGYELVANASGVPVWKQPSYAVCNTAGTTAGKSITITGFKMVTGARVVVKFANGHTGSSNATLNVNGLGGYAILLSEEYVYSYNSWSAGESVEFVFNGSGWVALSSDKQFVSGRPSVITVGSSTTTRYCDFKCTGTNDQIVIQQAISVLPSTGGKIVLLDGTYNIGGQINVNKPNVTICGMGNSTVLQRKFNGNNVIYVTSANCELAYFKVDGDSATYTNTANCNIQTYGAGYQNIHDITTVNATDCGIKIRNVCHYSNIYNISADGNKIGILFDGTTGAKICKNTVRNSTATGILLSWNTQDCIVAENVVDTATTYGICIENTNSCVRNVVANNVVRNSATNIYVNNSYNIVACNMVEPETGQKTIHVGSSGKYNYVTGNYIYSINYTNDGGTTNTFSNNKYS